MKPSGKPQKSSRKTATLAYAVKSFVGYLEGTEKALHTVKNYQCDLVSFQEFLEKGLGSSPVSLAKLTRQDLERYQEYLKARGLKTNTRRRKILTVRRLLRYLTSRNKVSLDVGQKLPAPHKIERIPRTVSYTELLEAVRALPVESDLQARNRVLLWTLLETGCLVSEVTRLRYEQWGASQVEIAGKGARTIPVSEELARAVQELRERAGDNPWLFLGFNKFGPLGSPITSRGVELLVKAYAGRLGFDRITPRTFRHSAVLYWYRQGLDQEQIQKRLGLKTAYAFRVYEPLFQSHHGSKG